MTVDLAVLDSLGIKLYSNAAAVLSELVANAYDADANVVSITWTQGGETVVVRDDGVGMTREQINKRFLTVGYQKRDEEGSISPGFQRPFMGRKGIGKLSVFSIAKTVTVYSTTAAGESSGLTIDIDDLEHQIKAGKAYHPTPVPVPAEYAKKGTALVLERLRTQRAALTVSALRKRLARRFDVLNFEPTDPKRFAIEVNGTPITYADRQDLKRLQFIWEFGQQTLPDTALPNGIGRFVLPDNTVGGDPSWKVTGWIGTARKPDDLRDDEDDGGSLKNVIVLARKRPIQEGIIEKLGFSRIFTSYVTGQVEADFLDLDDGYEDIATSDRQRLQEDDPRVVALQKFLRDALLKAAEQWSKLRNDKEGADILANNPRLRAWVDNREGWQKPQAEKLIKTIAGLPLDADRESDRPVLLQSGVLAFERIALNKVTEELDQLASLTAEDLLPLLGAQDLYEQALWGDILDSRIQAIEGFQGLIDEDAKEKVLQTHLFENLWLLDASWERATGSEHMEQWLHKIDPDVWPIDDKGDPLTGRIDVHYATAAKSNVIVELKRFGRTVDVEELYTQGLKYWQALRQVLEQKNRADEPIEVVFVLGAKPTAKQAASRAPDEYIRERLAPIGGRYALYNELTDRAISQYREYLDASKTVRGLRELLDSLNAEETGAADKDDGATPVEEPSEADAA